MNLRDLQSALNARGWTPQLVIDGEWGPRTSAAVEHAATSAKVMMPSGGSVDLYLAVGDKVAAKAVA